MGFHLLLTLVFGRLFRLNRLKIFLAANISNPFIAPFLFASEIQIGRWLRTGHIYSASMLHTIRLQGLAIDVLLGSAVVGSTLAIVGTALTYALMRGRGTDARVARLVDAAAARYLLFGVRVWESVYGKLRMDPVYLQVLRDGVLPNTGTLLDLGCGQGLMLVLIAEAQERYRLGDWPVAWPPPPMALRLRGIELRSRVAERASELLEGVATIEKRDLTGAALPTCSAVLIFDVLHLMSRDAQIQLLRSIAIALDSAGVLVIREADAAMGWRFRLVQIGNRFNAVWQGRYSRRFSFRTAGEWRAALEATGFVVTSAPDHGRVPHANFTLYARVESPPGATRLDAHERAGTTQSDQGPPP
jgi:SAM-dependent methyltransferase